MAESETVQKELAMLDADAPASTGKARGFVVDKDTGRPAPGVAVLATVEFADGRQLPVGMLASDAAGYVSFDLQEAIKDASPVQLHVKPIGDDTATITLPCNGTASSHGTASTVSGVALPFLLRVHRSSCSDCQDDGHAGPRAMQRAGLPAVQNPDLLDWRLSPSSFTTSKPLVLSEGACQVLVPAEAHKFATTVYRFNQVVRRSFEQASAAGAQGMASRQAVAEPVLASLLAASESGTQAAPETAMMVPRPPPGVPSGSDGGIAVDTAKSLELGQVLSFSQTWSPLGHSLGKIAYSLPLAPCESVNIAVIDWSRSDTAVRQDEALSRENLVHSQRRDRSLDEVVDAALEESQGGWSLQYGLGGATRGSASATIPIETVDLSLSAGHGLVGGFGYGTAQSWGERDLTASSLQDLHDSIVQATSVVRRLNSTVVVQASQQEKNYVETRTVTNHNHCHALTVQYHEVLQHLQVDTRYEQRRWAVLIPFKLVDFDWRLALRHRTILQTILLDSKLAPCFDAIVRIHHCPEIYATALDKPKGGGGSSSGSGGGVHAATPVQPGVSRYELVLSTGDRNTWGRIWVHLGLKDGTWKLLHEKASKQDGGEELWANTDYTKDITSGQAIGIDPAKIERVKVSWFEADAADEWKFKGIRIRYQTTGQPGLNPSPLVEEDKQPYLVDFNDSWGQIKEWIGAAKPAQPAGTDPTTTTPTTTEPDEQPKPPAYNKVDDLYCEQQLLVHLRANIGYYSRACWLLQDPTERVTMLDTLFATRPAVRNAIDPTPVAVNGSYVAFAFNGARAPEPVPSPELAPKREIVSMPTRGLFAETHLSNCNACEQRDVTRFWKWDESPCPEKAPDITQITPGPKGEPATVQPATLPNPVVQVMNAPSAPDPTGLAAALEVLGKPDIFRDMSTKAEVSKLLDGLISGSVTLAQAKEMATKAKESQAGAGAGRGANSTRSAPNEQSASGQIDKLDAIQYAADKGLISDQQKQDAAAAVVGGEPLPSEASGAGGSGQAGTVAGSTSATALPLIAAFEVRTGTSPWKLDRALVAKRLRELATDPDKVRQAALNLCGPAIFARLWAARDPAAFAQFAIELFEKGHSKIGEYEVRPGSDSLLGEDYAKLWAQHGADMPPQADWMILGSIRDAENFFFDYEGKPEEDIAAITLPGEVVEWMEATGAWTKVRDETNLFFTKGLDHARSLAPDSTTDVALLINVAMLPKQDLPFIMKVTPNHYIGLASKVRVSSSMVQLDYWTWGNTITPLSIPTATFEKHYYGAVIAQR